MWGKENKDGLKRNETQVSTGTWEQVLSKQKSSLETTWLHFRSNHWELTKLQATTTIKNKLLYGNILDTYHQVWWALVQEIIMKAIKYIENLTNKPQLLNTRRIYYNDAIMMFEELAGNQQADVALWSINHKLLIINM